MTDTDRMIALLRERGARGAHTSELRRLGISGNPSQRRKDAIAQGYEISSERESFIGAGGKRRPGARFVLQRERAPGLGAGAACNGCPADAPIGNGNTEQASVEPEGASLFDPPEPEPVAGDYRDPDAMEAA